MITHTCIICATIIIEDLDIDISNYYTYIQCVTIIIENLVDIYNYYTYMYKLCHNYLQPVNRRYIAVFHLLNFFFTDTNAVCRCILTKQSAGSRDSINGIPPELFGDVPENPTVPSEG